VAKKKSAYALKTRKTETEIDVTGPGRKRKHPELWKAKGLMSLPEDFDQRKEPAGKRDDFWAAEEG